MSVASASNVYCGKPVGNQIYGYLTERIEPLKWASEELAKNRRDIAFAERIIRKIELNTDSSGAEKLAGWKVRKQKSEAATDGLLSTLKQCQFSLCLIDEKGKRKEELSYVVGSGGSKVAIEISNDSVLILPNINQEVETEKFIPSWHRIVEEEVHVSRELQRIGLIAQNLEKVSVAFSDEENAETMHVYRTKSFQYIESSTESFIIDSKQMDGCSFKRNGCSLFKSPEEALIVENWDSVLAPLLDDIVTILLYEVPCPPDALNFIISKMTPEASTPSPYQVRYFGFDFSNKSLVHEIFEPRKRGDVPTKQSIEQYLKNVFWFVLYMNFTTKTDTTDLCAQLVNRHTEAVMGKIRSALPTDSE